MDAQRGHSAKLMVNLVRKKGRWSPRTDGSSLPISVEAKPGNFRKQIIVENFTFKSASVDSAESAFLHFSPATSMDAQRGHSAKLMVNLVRKKGRWSPCTDGSSLPISVEAKPGNLRKQIIVENFTFKSASVDSAESASLHFSPATSMDAQHGHSAKLMVNLVRKKGRWSPRTDGSSLPISVEAKPGILRNQIIVEEPVYMPQVEAISPTLPSEEYGCESLMQVTKEDIMKIFKKVDKDINQLDCRLSKLHQKMDDLEVEARKPAVSKEIVKDICPPIKSKQMSLARIIYSENRGKALDSQTILEKLGSKIEIPMYNQPSDTAVYHENKKKFQSFKPKLVKCLKKRHIERSMRETHLIDSYSKLMQDWKKKMEKNDNNSTKKAKDAKLRKIFEKQFPQLKIQRQDRISKVSTKIRSESEVEEIIDGLPQQESEEEKMRNCAVIPPFIVDPRQRNMCFLNNNRFVEDLSQENKDKQFLHVWTNQEKDIFQKKYLQHPKNFALIASWLERKSVAACIKYYYVSKQYINYKELLRKQSLREQTTAVQPPQNHQIILDDQKGQLLNSEDKAGAVRSKGP